MIEIDASTYKAKQANYHKAVTNKKQIVLCNSLRNNSYAITRMMNRDMGLSKNWVAYTVTRQGNVYEHFNPKYYADFLGDKNLDKSAIVISLENMGWLSKNPISGEYLNWANDLCSEDNVVLKQSIVYKFWERYPDSQILALGFLCYKLCCEFNIPFETIGFNDYNKTAVNFSGIMSRSNLIKGTYDVGPHFPYKMLGDIIDDIKGDV